MDALGRTDVRTPDDSRRVTVALGPGEVPDAALQLAVDLAVREHRGLRLAHVTPKPHGTAAQEWPLLDFKAVDLASSQVIEAAAEHVQHMSETAIDIERYHADGPVARVLTELGATSSHVVLTRRRLSPIRRVFTGSISTQLAAQAQVPVISVPEFWAPWHHQRPHVVVGAAPLDNQELFAYAVREAAARGCELDVIHAWTLPIFDEEAWVIRDEAAAWEGEVEAHLRDQLGALATDWQVPTWVRVERARPIDALVDATRNADLVLVGRAGRAGHLGSLTRALLREAHCPVGVLPIGPGVH